MADKEPRQPTHRAYSVIKREGQDDYWLNIGLVFPHKDSGGFNIMLQAFPLDGKIVCREISRGRRTDGNRDAPTLPAAGPAGRHRPRAALNGRASLRAGPVIRSVEFYNIELAPLADGRVYVAMLATTVDDQEPQLLTQEIACDTVATIEDALAVIRQAIEKV